MDKLAPLFIIGLVLAPFAFIFLDSEGFVSEEWDEKWGGKFVVICILGPGIIFRLWALSP